MLPETDATGARDVTEKVRKALAAIHVDWAGQRITVTLTAGVSVFDPGENLGSCLARADRALLQGKRAGKDRVVV